MKNNKEYKYIFVTGGVTSSLGKGIIASSLGMLLNQRGYKTSIQKLDPYINIDPGTLNPYEHGECYVTKDGAETDLDLGHYERFLNKQMSKYNCVTTGSVYKKVIERERKGCYLGKTVQIIPHITDEIKYRIKNAYEKENCDILIVEIGGTVGDIESLPYIESIRQIIFEVGYNNAIVIHLTLIPYLKSSEEIKTKPTQHSVRSLMESGIKANILVTRTSVCIPEDIKSKIALFCNVKKEHVIEAVDVKTIYEVPFLLKKQKFDKVAIELLKLPLKKCSHNIEIWQKFLENYKNPDYIINVALVGKYVSLKDAYKSIHESLIHAGAKYKCKINITWINSDEINNENLNIIFKNINGVIIAPGFGVRGIEGKILTAKFCRENNIPTLGICLGMQIMAIEFAKNVLNIHNASSEEFNNTYEGLHNNIIILMKDQRINLNKGGTMRLGDWECELNSNSMAFKIYNKKIIFERHRHRYEFNNKFIDQFIEHKFIPSGINKENNLVEIIEYRENKYYIGVQFHPEYKSTVINPHPLFTNFVKNILH